MIPSFAAEHPGARIRVSPSWNERRGGLSPSILLLHYTGMASGSGAEERLCDPTSEVSAHYLVHEDGEVVQMVPEALRAWHAGAGSWQGLEDINSRSIGIEIVNRGHSFDYPDFPAAQIEAVVELCRDITARRGIPPERVLAHSDTAPGRKVDPGEKFPWDVLVARGLALGVEEDEDRSPVLGPGDVGASVGSLQRLLSDIGYGIELTGLFDTRTCAVVDAFQRRFRRSHVSGAADRGTITTVSRVHACIRARDTV